MLHQVLSNLKFLVQVFIDKKKSNVNDIYKKEKYKKYDYYFVSKWNRFLTFVVANCSTTICPKTITPVI